MQRLSGWMPTAIRGDHGTGDVVLSLAVREVEDGSFLFALCQDHKLRMWSITDKVILEGFYLVHLNCLKNGDVCGGQRVCDFNATNMNVKKLNIT